MSLTRAPTWHPSIETKSLFLAPLAGVSDIPFRRICQEFGADLTYVEMLSAAALLRESSRTFQMMGRHEGEPVLGVQVTGRNADEIGRAVAVLSRGPYETIDLNMGCPVQKVVTGGCGSALLKNPQLVFEIVKAAVQNTDKPLSVKVRLGWDRTQTTIAEVGDAVEQAGAAWLTIHGRYRSDDYSTPVDLDCIRRTKSRLKIPVLGNGNIFTLRDAEQMYHYTTVDGVMVSRGALGNPWIFREIRGLNSGAEHRDQVCKVHLDEWLDVLMRHLQYQEEAYGDAGYSAIIMRKNLLWYVTGWPGARKVRDLLARVNSLEESRVLVREFAASLAQQGVEWRAGVQFNEDSGRFVWDPKWDMDRQLDRGVGSDDRSLSNH